MPPLSDPPRLVPGVYDDTTLVIALKTRRAEIRASLSIATRAFSLGEARWGTVLDEQTPQVVHHVDRVVLMSHTEEQIDNVLDVLDPGNLITIHTHKQLASAVRRVGHIL